MTQKMFGITGWKNSGKTRLTSLLVRELTNRGLKISTIKHAHHTFDIDHEGKDTWQHRQAGASEVAIVSNKRWALMSEIQNDHEPSLDEIATKLAPCDLILVEGYKAQSHLKLETIRPNEMQQTPIFKNDPTIVGLISDEAIEDTSLPIFKSEDISRVANFILETLEIKG